MGQLLERYAVREQLWIILAIGLGIGLLSSLLAFQVLRPLPAIAPTLLQPSTSRLGPMSPLLPWPRVGSAAVAVEGLGTIGTFGPQISLPMASTAKMMVGVLVLEGHPLGLGEQGPMLPITAADVATYQNEKADGQSVFPVTAGEQLTEYQALQALLIPSGNNIADLLADWDSGAVSSFLDKMNARAAQLGLRQTHFIDVSGVAAETSSSPQDLIVLARLAMRNPVFAQIVAQPDANLPVAGRVFNVNAAVGQDGIIGVKTGSTSASGACFVFAADATADQQPARLFGAIMGQPTLDDAFSTARNLIDAITPALHYRTVLSTLQAIAEYQAPWGDDATVFAPQEIDWVVFDGMTLNLQARLRPLKAPTPSGTDVGMLTVLVGDHAVHLPLQTTYPIDQPSLFWRLTRTQLLAGSVRID